MILAVLPPGLLAELAGVAAAPLITVYVSDPTSPFDRSSYVLIGALGIDPDHEPLMRGPLKPGSIPLFSASDNKTELLLPDVARDDRFKASEFTRRLGVRSLFRLSLHVHPTGPDDEVPWLLRRNPTLLEVFVNYPKRRTAQELGTSAAAVRRFLADNMQRITAENSFQSILNPRRTAKTYRRLERIFSRVAETGEALAPGKGLSRGVREGYAELVRFVMDLTELPYGKTTASLHYCYDWGDGVPEPILLHMHPQARASEINNAIMAEPTRGICRYVARTGTSVVLDDVRSAPEEWRGRHVRGPIEGLSVTIPLFAGERLQCVLNLESEKPLLSARSAASLCRMIPQIERFVSELIAQKAIVENLVTREVIHTLHALPLGPLDAAQDRRLDRLGRYLDAGEVSCIEWDGPVARGRQWNRQAGTRALSWAGSADGLRRHLEKHADIRVLSSVVAEDGARVHAYSLDRRRRPQRAWLKRVPAVVETALGEISESSMTTDKSRVRTDLVVPLWQSRPEDHQKFVKGLLIVSYPGLRFCPTPLRIENLDSVARAFGISTSLVKRVAQRASLYAWATAGVGPIHQLIKVVDECRLDIDKLSGSEEVKRMALERCTVFSEQLRVWHQFAQTAPQPGLADGRAVELGAVVTASVNQALLLTGEVHAVPVRIDPEDARATIRSSRSLPIAAVLSCAISNSTRYGIGFDEVRAGIDGGSGRAWIAVENRAVRSRTESHLAEARTIAGQVAAGDTVSVFEQLAARSEKEGLRGLGTWLAARVTRELLRGSYEIQYERVPGNDDELRVTAEISFPLHQEPGGGAGKQGGSRVH